MISSQYRQSIVRHRVGRQTSIGDLDCDVIMAEQGGQAIQLGRRDSLPCVVRADRTWPFRQPVKIIHCACAALAQLLEVVQRTSLLVASQLCIGDRRG